MSEGPSNQAPPSSEITRLLEEWNRGEAEALDQLMPLVVKDLRAIAHSLHAGDTPSPTLQTTELVSELYLRLAGKRTVQWKNRGQFFAEMANMIRRILVEVARRRLRLKRGSGQRPEPLHEIVELARMSSEEIVRLNDALRDLARRDERRSQIVHLRFFVGLNNQRIASILDLSERTVKREWSAAKHWLYQYFSQD